ncbi:hypothetical protein [Vibrio anguillarum]|uniref:hypothetical protein n=1 Tax=Vibrio anguillarum TaxID=55601 RepID=UPI00097E1733|nr:hypothetical protein [Vibrio anguillarum]AQM20559.1 hypothetical protein PN51_12520 [Vibrio anguillarum]AUB88984.1 hypothetical protein CKY00_17310 [Vibrio anguillarum]AUB92424.1 hypothetical protein CKX99_17325 [Vibrio anguillarum]AUB95859.1 hypothetical protein CK210_17310 [Vibrio anguillarum]AUB99280.1 hypothetical protein CK209_17240 [Vibrio anguillarum]
MSIIFHPLVLTFILLLVSAHVFGYKTSGKWSKSYWKAGDYIWLSLAFFALINALSTTRINEAVQAEKVLRQKLVSSYNDRISNLEEGQAFMEKHFTLDGVDSPAFDIGLKELAEDASTIDARTAELKNDISENESHKAETAFEKNAKSLYVYFLIIGLAIRITMASAEVFDWYKK